MKLILSQAAASDALKDEIVTSESGRRMLGYVVPIYDFDRFALCIFQALGVEMDDAWQLVKEVRQQAFVQTATWGLRYWEQRCGLPVNESLPVEERRRRILTWMLSEWPITRVRMEDIVRAYSGDPQAYIREIYDQYRFEVFFDLLTSFDLKQLFEVVDEVKPAHLSFSISMGLRQGDKRIFVGAAMTAGEEVTVYPWTVSELTSHGKTYIVAGRSNGIETATVFPKGE